MVILGHILVLCGVGYHFDFSICYILLCLQRLILIPFNNLPLNLKYLCYDSEQVTSDVMEVFSRTFGNGYMKLQKVALIDEFYGYHLGLIIFASNLKLLKILSFNNKMSLLIFTLSRYLNYLQIIK